MAVVGSAEIVVRAITKQVKQDIEKAFNDARPAASSAGNAMGKDFGSSFGSSAQSSIKSGLGGAFDDAGSGAGSAGDKAGRNYGGGVQSGFSSSSSSFSSKVERQMGSAGDKGGNAFTRALHGKFANASVAASKAFTPIFAMANIAGTGISTLVSSLSALVSGLFAVGSAAAQAIPALGALGGMAGVAIQAGGALKLAFSGVGAALSAGLKPATGAAKKASSGAVSNANAVADATRSLQRARQDAARGAADADRQVAEAHRQAAESMRAADRDVADAHRDLAESERNLLGIQKELNAARKEAAEQLQQLAFDAEDAALAQERAGLTLEDAFKKLQSVQSLPPDARARREAELSYKEAELAFRQAKDRNSDMAKEQKRAAKAGIEGSEAVQDVRRKEADAENDIADKRRALADAEEKRAQTRADNARSIAAAERARADQALQSARSIADAERAVAKARQQGADATTQAAGAADAYGSALDKLSPAAREFVKYLVSIKDRFDGIKAAAGAELFPKLTQAIKTVLSGPVLGMLNETLKVTGSLLGDAALGVAQVFAQGSKNRLGKVMRGNNEILRVFTERGKGGENTFSRLTRFVLRFLTAVQPVTKRFAEWINHLTVLGERNTRSAKSMEKLTGFFNRAGDKAALLGRVVKNLFGVFVGLGKAASPAGTGLIVSFNKYLHGLNKFVNSAGGQKKLQKYFKEVADNVRPIAHLVRLVGKEFGKLGANKGVGDFATTVTPAVKNFGKIAQQMTGAGGGLGELIVQISDLLVVLSDTGGIKIFFDVLNKALGLLNSFAQSSFGKWFLITAGTITAFARALSFVGLMGKKMVMILLGGPISVLQKIFKKGKEAGGGLDSMTSASDRAKAALERQITVDELKLGSLKALEEQALLTAGALDRVQAAGAPVAGAGADAVEAEAKAVAGSADEAVAGATNLVPAGGGAAGLTDDVAKAGVPDIINPATEKKVGKMAKATGGLTKVFKGLGVAALGLIGISPEMAAGFGAMLAPLLPMIAIIAAVVAALVGLFFFFKALYKHSPEFKAFIDGIVGKFKEFVGFIKDVVGKALGWLGDFFGDVFDKIFSALNSFFGVVNAVLPKVGKAIGDFVSGAWSKIQPVLSVMGSAFAAVFKGIVWAVTHLLVPAMKILWEVVKFAWNSVIRPVLGAMVAVFKAVFTAVKWTITNIVVPAFQLLWKGLQAAWNVIKSVLGFLWKAVKFAFGLVRWYITNLVLPAFQLLWKGLQIAWGIIKGILKFFWAAFKVAFNVVKFVIVNLVVPALKLLWATFQVLWEIVKPILQLMWATIKMVFNIIKFLIVNIAIPALKLLWAGFQVLWEIVKPILDLLWWGVKQAFNLIKWYATHVLIPIIKAIWGVFRNLWNIAKAVFNGVKWAVKKAFEGIRWIWNNVLKPAIDAIKAAFQSVKDKLAPVMRFINERWNNFKNNMTTVKDKVVAVVKVVRQKFEDAKDKVVSIVKTIRNKLDDWTSKMEDIKKSIRGKIQDIKDKFGEIPGAVTNAFKNLGSHAVGGINSFIRFVNNNLIAKVNAVTSKFGLTIHDIPTIKGFEQGGWTGPGNKKKVAGLVHADEYVIPKAARQAIEREHPGALDLMRKTGTIPRAYLPMGDWGPFGLIAGAASGAWNSISNLASAGVGKVLEGLVNGAKGLMSGAGIKHGPFLNDLFYGVMDKIADLAKTWGQGKQAEADRKAAPKGGTGGGTTKVNDPSNPAAHSQYKGGTFSNRFIAHLKAAERIAHAGLQIYQGGWNPGGVSASGTSHWGDAIDIHVNYALLRALRQVGIAAGDRTGLGSWAPHIHAIPGPAAGYARGSAIWQWTDYVAMGGIRQGPRTRWGLNKFAEGGVVRATPGGILANIGEAGRNERVEPLSADGMSKRDRVMMDLIRQQMAAESGGGGDTFHVHPSPGMDEAALAQMVSRRVAWKRSVGT